MFSPLYKNMLSSSNYEFVFEVLKTNVGFLFTIFLSLPGGGPIQNIYLYTSCIKFDVWML